MVGIISGLTSALNHMNGSLALGLISALVFGETAIFLGFVLPGEAAVVLGGVLASRGHLSIWMLALVAVLAAVTGPLVGYEIGQRMGGRLFDSRALRRVPRAAHRVRTTMRDKGAVAVLGGRFVAVLRALMPAAAGAVRMPYRQFLLYNMIGGVIWGVGYSLLGYLAGSAYAVVERTVGTGLAVGVVAVVVAPLAVVGLASASRSAGPGGRPPGTPRGAGPGGRPPGTPRGAGPGGRPLRRAVFLIADTFPSYLRRIVRDHGKRVVGCGESSVIMEHRVVRARGDWRESAIMGRARPGRRTLRVGDCAGMAAPS